MSISPHATPSTRPDVATPVPPTMAPAGASAMMPTAEPGPDRAPGEISPEAMRFSFSDLIAGYVIGFDPETDLFELRTVDDRRFPVLLTATTQGELLRNLGEPARDVTGRLRELLTSERYVFAHGMFYPEGNGFAFECKHVILIEEEAGRTVFEEPNFWSRHLYALADFYQRAQFGEDIDFRRYRTRLGISGEKVDDRQETATMSRLIYGMATAYALTGEERFLSAARRGCAYMIEHMRSQVPGGHGTFWVHGLDLTDPPVKLLVSEFDDDAGSIPLYEQIYALAGLSQTYRLTRDPAIGQAVSDTIEFIDRYYRDEQGGGYFSHIDAVHLDPRHESLGANRARKNWNSVGDHAPAYLINLLLATGEERHREMLVRLADTIVEKFPDDASPFVNERFHEDWKPDLRWGWQQNRAVVGHNLKIAWNLMRVHAIAPDERYVQLAERLARRMPEVGQDRQRGGWYDVIERWRDGQQQYHRLVWHNRKAWWQQEQAILAYLVLAGRRGDPEFRRLARESEAFYLSWFPDHDSGGVYFNVLADGLPYLVHGERMKGNHAMSGYHAFELAYLSAVYNDLLVIGRPLHLHFRVNPSDLGDGVLRVAPDLLAPGEAVIREVWVNGELHGDFDAEGYTVHLTGTSEVPVEVRLVPARAQTYGVLESVTDDTAVISVEGDLDGDNLRMFEQDLRTLLDSQPHRLVVRAERLNSMDDAAARAIVLLQQQRHVAETYVVGANDAVRRMLQEIDPSGEAVLLVADESLAPIGGA